jgi:hypothetical protein
MEDKLLKLTMRLNSGQQFEVSIAADETTVNDLKTLCIHQVHSRRNQAHIQG